MFPFSVLTKVCYSRTVELLSISKRGAEGEPLPFEMMEQSCNKSKLFWLAFFAVTITLVKAARLLAFFGFNHYHCECCV
jgi:hypothetical protein